LSNVFGKYAATEKVLSIRFLAFYAADLMILFVYSIAWQFILQKFPLSFAYFNKGIVMVWGVMFGIVLFHETINIATLISIALIIVGICVLGNASKDG
jgi:multidrug transporter EmrE-like cation transporter